MIAITFDTGLSFVFILFFCRLAIDRTVRLVTRRTARVNQDTKETFFRMRVAAPNDPSSATPAPRLKQTLNAMNKLKTEGRVS